MSEFNGIEAESMSSGVRCMCEIRKLPVEGETDDSVIFKRVISQSRLRNYNYSDVLRVSDSMCDCFIPNSLTFTIICCRCRATNYSHRCPDQALAAHGD